MKQFRRLLAALIIVLVLLSACGQKVPADINPNQSDITEVLTAISSKDSILPIDDNTTATTSAQSAPSDITEEEMSDISTDITNPSTTETTSNTVTEKSTKATTEPKTDNIKTTVASTVKNSVKSEITTKKASKKQTTTSRVNTSTQNNAESKPTTTKKTAITAQPTKAKITTSEAPKGPSVKLIIECSEAVAYGNTKYPSGVILSSKSITLEDGDSVFDILNRSGVSVDSSRNFLGVNVAAIGGLREKECGGQSGWVYEINGVQIMKSSDKQKLANGDSVVWKYIT